MDKVSDKQRKSGFSIFLFTIYAISISLCLYFLIAGFSFYKTPYQLRPRLETYRTLRPAGDFGHGVGIVGSAMMLFMLLYSLRKRTNFFGHAGKLRHWLDIHIYFGIIGPLLVVLHSTFKVQGLIAVSFWSMVAVALSGIFGRYLYLQIPRNIDDENLSLKDIENAKAGLDKQLKENFAIKNDLVAAVSQNLTISITHDTGLIRSLKAILIDDITRPFKTKRLKRDLAQTYNVDYTMIDEICSLTRRKNLLERKILLFDQIQQLFHYWHVFHKPFAIIMYIIMLVHIGVAIWLGYTWKF